MGLNPFPFCRHTGGSPAAFSFQRIVILAWPRKFPKALESDHIGKPQCYLTIIPDGLKQVTPFFPLKELIYRMREDVHWSNGSILGLSLCVCLQATVCQETEPRAELLQSPDPLLLPSGGDNQSTHRVKSQEGKSNSTVAIFTPIYHKRLGLC